MSHRGIATPGTGYIGTAAAIGMGRLGYSVAGFDVDPPRIARVRAGIPPYREAAFEADLPLLLERDLSALDQANGSSLTGPIAPETVVAVRSTV